MADSNLTTAPKRLTEKESVKNPSSGTRGLRRGGSPGRPKGVQNKVTREVREFAQRILQHPKGQAKLLEQYQRGCLPPPILIMLFHYVYGPPKKTVQLEGHQIETLRFVIDDHACRAAVGSPHGDESTGEGVPA